jgi:hypothetical protein
MRRSVDAAAAVAASSNGSLSVRGAAANGTASSHLFSNAPSPRPSLSNSSDFNVRGAAASAASTSLPSNRHSTSQPTPGQQSKSSFGNSSYSSPASAYASSNTKILTGYGHCSATGIPAFPGVHGSPAVTGTERRTPGGWSWTRN